MDIAQMRMMLVLAECRSMTTTAKKLHVSQPALTYQIKVIENELGFKVFNRTRIGTSLTAEGAFLLETLNDIVDRFDESVRLARAMAKGTAAGTVRVGTNAYSRDTVSFFLNMSQSGVSFSLVPCGTSDPVKLLREGVIDFWSTSAASMENASSALRFAELSSVGQSAFVSPSHRLAKRQSLTMDDLKDDTIWLWPQGEASAPSNVIRDRLNKSGTDVEDFVPGVSAIVTAFVNDDIAVYDDGYLPPPARLAVQIPIVDAPQDVLGLVYLSAREEQLAPILADLADRVSYNKGRAPSSSELAAERIVTVLEEIANAVRRGGMKDVLPLVEYGIDLGISSNHIMNRGLLNGMSAVSDSYQKGDVYTAEMMASVATANLAMEALQPRLAAEGEKPISGTAVIGTVLGDQHDIGKNLVRIMLESRDIEVTDLGNRVSAQSFIEHLRNNPDCNLMLVSISRTDLLDNVRSIIKALKAEKLRDRVFIMIGGAAASQEFADEIDADAYTASAEDAADKAVEFLSL